MIDLDEPMNAVDPTASASISASTVIETHIFGSHSEYWKEEFTHPPSNGRRRNNSANELFEQDN